MKLFVSNDFIGHWPVGTAAVVLAENEEEAKKLLDKELKERGLEFDGTLIQIPQTKPIAVVLRDGNY